MVRALHPAFGFRRVCGYSTPRSPLDPDFPKEFLPPQNHGSLNSYPHVCISHTRVYAREQRGQRRQQPRWLAPSQSLLRGDGWAWGRTLQHTVLERGALPGPSTQSRVHPAMPRFPGARPLLALSLHLCRACLQEGRLGEPSGPRVAHSRGARRARLPGFRICLLLPPVCASVSSPGQWGREGGCCGDPESSRVSVMWQVRAQLSESPAPAM